MLIRYESLENIWNSAWWFYYTQTLLGAQKMIDRDIYITKFDSGGG